MTIANRIRLSLLMTLSGGYGIITLIRLVSDVAQDGAFDGDLLIMGVYLFVIFILAAESYGLQLQFDKLRVRNAILANSLEIHNQRIENERP